MFNFDLDIELVTGLQTGSVADDRANSSILRQLMKRRGKSLIIVDHHTTITVGIIDTVVAKLLVQQRGTNRLAGLWPASLVS